MGLKYLELTLIEPEAPPADSDEDYSEEQALEYDHSAWSGFERSPLSIREEVTAGTPVHVVFHYYGKYPPLASALCP